MPAAKTKAHLTGGHKMRPVPPTSGMPAAKPSANPSYSTQSVPAPTGMSQMGGKALAGRAKKVLEPLSDPNEAP